jgi:hypothetical protein
MYTSFLYMLWAKMCPSSGEITVSMRHLVFVTLCDWLSGMPTGQSLTKSDKYHVSHRYSYFSWWWAHSRPKHVEKRNKLTKRNCSPSWLYLQDLIRDKSIKSSARPWWWQMKVKSWIIAMFEHTHSSYFLPFRSFQESLGCLTKSIC